MEEAAPTAEAWFGAWPSSVGGVPTADRPGSAWGQTFKLELELELKIAEAESDGCLSMKGQS